jgi:hypothetical protein
VDPVPDPLIIQFNSILYFLCAESTSTRPIIIIIIVITPWPESASEVYRPSFQTHYSSENLVAPGIEPGKFSEASWPIQPIGCRFETNHEEHKLSKTS